MCVVSDDNASVHEYPLLLFILQWADENSVHKYELARVLEHVRFTKMSMQCYFEAVSLPALAPFLRSRNKLDSLKNGKKFHDPPVTTRNSGKSFAHMHDLPFEILILLIITAIKNFSAIL